MLIKKVTQSMNLYRIEWQRRIHVTDYDQSIEDIYSNPKF